MFLCRLATYVLMADEIVNEAEAKELVRAEARKAAADKRDEESKVKQVLILDYSTETVGYLSE